MVGVPALLAAHLGLVKETVLASANLCPTPRTSTLSASSHPSAAGALLPLGVP